MKEEDYNWIDEELEGLKKVQRAKPASDLFDRIEQTIDYVKAKQISIRQLRMIAAAAVFLLILNGFVLTSLLKREAPSQDSHQYSQSTIEEQLVSDYNIYE